MAGRNFRSQFAYGYAVPVTLRAQVSFASGVASIASGTGMAIRSIVHNSAGDYTVTLSDPYNGLLDVRAIFLSGASAPVAPIMSVRTDAVSTLAAPVLRLQFRSLAGALTDPDDTEVLHLSIELSNSSTAY